MKYEYISELSEMISETIISEEYFLEMNSL